MWSSELLQAITSDNLFSPIIYASGIFVEKLGLMDINRF